MPIYEFKCEKCGEEFETMSKVSDRDSSPECKKCKGPTKRKISKTSFVLSGGGWAKDGYSG
jgi:putative FmdB family regulatory protein